MLLPWQSVQCARIKAIKLFMTGSCAYTDLAPAAGTRTDWGGRESRCAPTLAKLEILASELDSYEIQHRDGFHHR